MDEVVLAFVESNVKSAVCNDSQKIEVEVFSFGVICSSDGCINNNAAIRCDSVVESFEAKSIPSVINVSKCGDIEWEIKVVYEFRLD